MQVIQFLQDCFHSDCGGFGPFPQHDPNLLSTLSAVQIAAMYDIIDNEKALQDVILKGPNECEEK